MEQVKTELSYPVMLRASPTEVADKFLDACGREVTFVHCWVLMFITSTVSRSFPNTPTKTKCPLFRVKRCALIGCFLIMV